MSDDIVRVDWRDPYARLKDDSPGLFDAIMDSDHPAAERFQHWLVMSSCRRWTASGSAARPVRDATSVFDITLLASRLSFATDRALAQPETAGLRIGYFGASTSAGAALLAAAAPRSPAGAGVSRSVPISRPDTQPPVAAPTLLIVGGLDPHVIELNQIAYDRLGSPKDLVIVEGAGHLFE